MNFLTDKKYVISLEKREDRRKSMAFQFDTIGATNYEFFNAMNGSLLYDTEKVKRGALGCRISHQMVIQVAKQLKLPYVTILEDDASFCGDFVNRYNKVISQLPENFDIFQLGGNNMHKPLKMISENVGRCQYTLAPMCYVVKNTVYDRIIDAVNDDELLDVIYATKVHPFTESFCSSPSLVSQIGGWSDIENINVDFYKDVLNLWKP